MTSVITESIVHRKSESLWFLITCTTSDTFYITNYFLATHANWAKLKAPCRLQGNYILNAGYSRGLLIHDLDEKENNYFISMRSSYHTIPRPTALDRGLIPWICSMDLWIVFWFSPAARKETGSAYGDCNLFPRVEKELNYSYRLGKHVESQEKQVLAVRMFL